MISLSTIREQFPIFQKYPDLHYFDTAASSQTAQSVIDAMTAYYTDYRANIHRGVYKLSGYASYAFEQAHETLAQFVGAAQGNDIAITSGTTHALNMIAGGLTEHITSNFNIVITEMEHHSNVVPWQQLAQRTGAELRFIKLTDQGMLDLEHAATCIDANTAVVSCVHVSNVLGTINPISILAERAHAHGAFMVVDGAQSIAHMSIDVQAMGCDAFVASGHKMYGPTGVGFAYLSPSLQAVLAPWMTGGGMVSAVSKEQSAWKDTVERYEAGTPPIAGAIGLMYAVEFLKELDHDALRKHEQECMKMLYAGLQDIAAVTVVGPDADNRSGVVAFQFAGLHPHDVASMLDAKGIAVRAGYHCAVPLSDALACGPTVRASIGCYTSIADVQALLDALDDISKTYAAT
jgi:cysteine desulfurase/selenocysteine lyase